MLPSVVSDLSLLGSQGRDSAAGFFKMGPRWEDVMLSASTSTVVAEAGSTYLGVESRHILQRVYSSSQQCGYFIIMNIKTVA